MRLRLPLTLALLVVLSLVAACGGSSSSSSNSGSGSSGSSSRLTLVAYSTPKEAYEQLLPDFARTAAGRGTTFSQSYGSSGDQSRAVGNGLPADVVALSLEPDVTKLVDKGVVAPTWNEGPTRGFVTRSVVVLVTRKGNPRKIRGWDDLTKPGVEVITPNPLTSGGARWNVMAAYGAQLEQGRSEAQAEDYLRRLFKNVPVQDKSARESLQTFTGGKGDVLIAYENEAITAQQKGESVDYVLPEQTILIENPIAVVARSKNQAKAKALVAFLGTPAAQRVFAQKGYRPVRGDLVDPKRFPKPRDLFTIARFGGWGKVSDRFFDPQQGLLAKINQENDVASG